MNKILKAWNYLTARLKEPSTYASVAALATITPRRTREAILAIDTTWLADQEAAIALLRTQLAT